MLNRITFKARLILLTAIACVLFVLLGAAGLVGIKNQNQALEIVNQNNTVKLLLDNVFTNIQSTHSELLLALQHAPDSPFLNLHDHPVSQHLDNIAANREENMRAWEQFGAMPLTETERQLSERLQAAVRELRSESVNAVMQEINKQDYYTANRLLLTRVNPAVEKVGEVMKQISDQLMGQAQLEFNQGEQRYQQTLKLFIIC